MCRFEDVQMCGFADLRMCRLVDVRIGNSVAHFLFNASMR
jgi:hypothetical protein